MSENTTANEPVNTIPGDAVEAVSLSGAPRFDLTQTISPYLDRHLVFPLLEFLQAKKVYPEEDILRAKLDMLGHTGMLDFAIDIYKRLNHTEEIPEDLKEKRQVVVATLKKLQIDCGPLLKIVDDSETVSKLISENVFTVPYLQEHYDISLETVDSLYKFAKFQFDIGNYSGAADYLHYYRVLTPSPSSSERALDALWGKLAADILMQNWESALENLHGLNEMIDQKQFGSQLEQLHQRTWLIHWSLFVFFNHPNGRNGIIDLFLMDKFLNVVQLTCPWILRYLTTAVITSKRRQNAIKSLVKMIQQEEYEYSDPITQFLDCVFVKFDFDAAQEKLKECEQLLSTDFFLVSCQEEFVENARLIIFETYCTIHKKIDIAMLATKLSMDQDTAEQWIVNLIRNTRMNARLDSENGQVIMMNQYEDVYEQVMAKTKVLPRTDILVSALKPGGATPIRDAEQE